VSDVGGGSTELVLGSWDGVRGAVEAARSVDVGCVRLTERCLRSDPPTVAEVAEATRVAGEVLAEAFAVVPVAKARGWIGVAGTVTTLAAIAQDLPAYDPGVIHLTRMPFEQVREITDRLLGMTSAERSTIGAMHEGRVDVIIGGLLVVRVIADHLAAHTDITELVASEHDILDGIAYALA